jgi:hypothetical protein
MDEVVAADVGGDARVHDQTGDQGGCRLVNRPMRAVRSLPNAAPPEPSAQWREEPGRCLVQRGRPQRRGSPGDLREQGGQASLMVVGEEEGQPISVDAPHDRFDIERRPVGGVEVQLSDAALTEPLRRNHLGPPATHIDGPEEKETLPGLHHHGPRHVESRVSPWESPGPISRSTSKCRVGVDRVCSRRSICSRSGPCTHVGLLRNAMGCAAVQANCIRAYDANSPVGTPPIGLWSNPHPGTSPRPAPQA